MAMVNCQKPYVIKTSGLTFEEYPFEGIHKVEKMALLEWAEKCQLLDNEH